MLPLHMCPEPLPQAICTTWDLEQCVPAGSYSHSPFIFKEEGQEGERKRRRRTRRSYFSNGPNIYWKYLLISQVHLNFNNINRNLLIMSLNRYPQQQLTKLPQALTLRLLDVESQHLNIETIKDIKYIH